LRSSSQRSRQCSFDLREVEHLVDKAQEVGPGGKKKTERRAKATVMALDPSYLAQADRHVAKLKALISDQEALIELLSADDQRTQLAETLLGTMKDTLRLFEEHRQSMLTQIEDLPELESSTGQLRH
jgi:gamma-glutamyl phosphate reductase